MWIWQQANWPEFFWDDVAIMPLLQEVRLNQGILIGKAKGRSLSEHEAMLSTLLANIVHSSAIESEKLNAASVRSSLARKLDIREDKPFPTSRQTDNLADMMLDAVLNFDSLLTLERLLGWHEGLFPEGYTLFNPIQGGVLRGDSPMQVVSGRLDKPTVHFEAPGRDSLEQQLAAFVAWFNDSRHEATLDPLLRAGITHLWFITLHPFDDGNGRITRLLTDLALAQAENQSIRLYAMSVAILDERKAYYHHLETTQKGDLNITRWLSWFLNTLNTAIKQVLKDIDQVAFKTAFWQSVDQTRLTTEQVKVLNRLLAGDFPEGINTSQYHKVAKVSKATATRHLALLVELGCLVKKGGGRSTRYVIGT